MAFTQWPAPVIRLARAIAVAEGSSLKYNNPGDLTGADAGTFPTFGTFNADGCLIFANQADGWTALYQKCNRMLAGISKVYHLTDTLEVVGLKYANQNVNWAKNVAGDLGVSESTTLQQIALGAGT